MRLELLDIGNSGLVQCSSFGEDHVTQERYFVLNQLAFPEIYLQAVDHDSPECFVQQIQSLPHCCGSLPDIVHSTLTTGTRVPPQSAATMEYTVTDTELQPSAFIPDE
ncbi:hypothetical protein MRX96_039111 [Rhipicephalus microplus]